ncbi:hypothetical protein ACJMK2_022879 [Sinanodonta woodiana]|uniref:2-C-methyl-D-erythritol 4-phosphate cytidylyltransferase, chloroplastic n=1 Tax=Sinanodonta woodiana TaxID=1069815 RepID=A0ABD3TN73_SINWO
MDFNVCVVLPASGTGERLVKKPPKQYSLLLDKPIILHTLSAFHRISWVSHIVITVSSEYDDYVKDLIRENGLHKVTVTLGAPTRHRSIFNGIKAVGTVCENPDIVVIHDVVRVFAEEDTVQKVALAAKTYGAAGVTRPLVSTVISTDSEGLLEKSLDRSKYMASEMPQAFQFNIISQAYEKATDFDFDYGTECLLLAMKYTGTKAKLISGTDNLWKVTYPKDLYAANGMMKEKLLTVCVQCEGDASVRKKIEEKCSNKNLKVCADLEYTAVNNVFCYAAFDENKICVVQENTQIVLSVSKSSSSSPLIKPVSVHVFRDSCVSMKQYCVLVKKFQSLARKFGKDNILMYGILDQAGSEVDSLSEMVATILWERNEALNGQVFLIPA